LLKIIEEEIEAREQGHSHSQQQKNTEQNIPTATNLMSSAAPFTVMCCYCQQPHLSAKCTTVAQVEARKQILKRSGHCFCCLKEVTLAENAVPCMIKCFLCNSRHHTSICTKELSQQSSNGASNSANSTAMNTNPATTNVGRPNTLESGQGNKTTLNPNAATFTTPTTTALHVCANKSVFLQTAQAEVYNPLNPQLIIRVHVVLDNGSQRSYITYRVKDALNLESQNIQCVSIATFGAERKENRFCETVNIFMKMKHDLDQEIVAFIVPHICEPIAPNQ